MARSHWLEAQAQRMFQKQELLLVELHGQRKESNSG